MKMSVTILVQVTKDTTRVSSKESLVNCKTIFFVWVTQPTVSKHRSKSLTTWVTGRHPVCLKSAAAILKNLGLTGINFGKKAG